MKAIDAVFANRVSRFIHNGYRSSSLPTSLVSLGDERVLEIAVILILA